MKRTTSSGHLARLDKLESMLKSEDFLTVRALSHALHVSTRTLYRDINILRDRGLPIDADKGKGGGVRLHRSWGVGKLSLTEEESVDLLLSLAMSDRLNSPLFLESLQSIKYKLLALLSTDQKRKIESLRSRVLIGSSASPSVHASYEQSDVPICSALKQAFISKLCLEVSYEDENKRETHRVIEPHYLYFNTPVWYIFAWDHLRMDFRVFRVDRIKRSFALSARFELRPKQEFEHLIETDSPISL